MRKKDYKGNLTHSQLTYNFKRQLIFPCTSNNSLPKSFLVSKNKQKPKNLMFTVFKKHLKCNFTRNTRNYSLISYNYTKLKAHNSLGFCKKKKVCKFLSYCYTEDITQNDPQGLGHGI